jgi:hypothetical protein
MKLNPYEQGVADYRNNLRGCNPFRPFTAKWALYNKGYNSCWMPKQDKEETICIPATTT